VNGVGNVDGVGDDDADEPRRVDIATMSGELFNGRALISTGPFSVNTRSQTSEEDMTLATVSDEKAI